MEEHILVVDDEEYMRSLLSLALAHKGFFVTTAADATEALALFGGDSEAQTHFDLLLTDFNMPGVTGLELVETLRSNGEQLPCLVMSGSPNGMLATEALARGCAGFIRKPFTGLALAELIRKTLGLSQARGATRPGALMVKRNQVEAGSLAQGALI